MRINNFPIFAGQTINASANSEPIWLGHAFGYSIQITPTGTAAGTAVLQLSDDDGGDFDTTNPPTVTNWITITGTSQAVSGTTSIAWNISDVQYRWARVSYTHTSGSSTFNARVNTKGF